MGSSYFYLEFLLTFLTLLRSCSKFKNPAILALEYDLVPDKSYPVQLQQTIAGYNYLQSIICDPSKIVLCGDSAGATLILSLLLYLGFDSRSKISSLPTGEFSMNGPIKRGSWGTKPAMAVLISPWTTLLSTLDHNTSSDYLNVSNLHNYAKQYAGTNASPHDPLISPGECIDYVWWRESSPIEGFFINYGTEEVFAPAIKELISLLLECGAKVEWHEAEGGIHAWTIASFFLCATQERRMRGLKGIVKQICQHMEVRYVIGSSV
jgi:acetyl esterase/lipase